MSPLCDELRAITRPNELKTDDEAAADRARALEICLYFGELCPEDVLEKYDPPPSEYRWNLPHEKGAR